ncbi:MAG: hypothetical protein R3C39_01195 [Dehalococcoidia bacterium]
MESTTLEAVRGIAADFAKDRHERQRRRELDFVDFDALADAGFLRTGIPAGAGGLFDAPTTSTRPIAEMLRALAHGDSSVALVASMHPAVLSFWNACPDVPQPDRDAWRAQRDELAAHAADGHWFGTITSEPGSGGDIANTRSEAVPEHDAWAISGTKHFGSGSGMSSFMLTSALPAGEARPDWFVFDLRDAATRESHMKIVAPWDGHGMTATQSHGIEFDHFPAQRAAWPGHLQDLSDTAGPFVIALFTAVVFGIVEAAVEAAREQLRRRPSLRPYEQVEWANVEQDAWLMEQAYEGLLRSIEAEEATPASTILAKTASAQLAENCLRRITRVLGGGTFARHAPFGFWFEDVRALGFLRPSWGMSYDGIAAGAFAD